MQSQQGPLSHVHPLLHLRAAAHLPVGRKAALQGQVALPAHAAEACSIPHHCQMPAPCQLTRHPLHLGGRHKGPPTSANFVVGDKQPQTLSRSARVHLRVAHREAAEMMQFSLVLKGVTTHDWCLASSSSVRIRVLMHCFQPNEAI